MKKFFKLGKRMLALFTVVLLNINSYAAVGANDGSAFVTKAEFDALVNTFNEQMDTYQSGLNAKIDGAISNYLAGLSSVSKESVQPFVNTPVWSVSNQSDVHTWEEGVMTMNISGYLVRVALSTTSADNTGAMVFSIKNAGNPSYYLEHIIDNDLIYNGYTRYNGYCKSNIELIMYGSNISNNNNWAYKNSGIFGRFMMQINKNEGKYLGWVTGDTSPRNDNSVDQGLASRITDETLFNDVICTPANGLEYPYFNPKNISDLTKYFCKDGNLSSNSIHKFQSSAFNVFKCESAKTYGWVGGTKYNNNLTITNYTDNNGWWFSVTRPTLSGGVCGCAPFIGFVDTIKNWKNVYVNTYDRIISELETKSGAHVAADEEGNKHLLVTNGLPMLKANRDDVIHIPLKFDKIDNEYKNIDIWLKASAFKLDENVKTTTDADIIKAENENNMIPSAYSNAITLDAINGKGEGMLKFKMPKDGYVFMKWSVAGNEAAGGGVFRPQVMSVEKVN